jgi:SAM-dependent methyltransferase
MNPLAGLESYLASRILSESAFARYQLGDVPHRELQPYVSELQRISQAYVTHDSGRKLSSPRANARSAEAYALYYTPINAAKILHLAPLLRFDSPEVSILDVGCGPGTAVLSLLYALNKRLRITCVENSSHMNELVSAESFYGIARVRKAVKSESNKPFEKAKVFDRLLVCGQLQQDLPADTVFTKANHQMP